MSEPISEPLDAREIVKCLQLLSTAIGQAVDQQVSYDSSAFISKAKEAVGMALLEQRITRKVVVRTVT